MAKTAWGAGAWAAEAELAEAEKAAAVLHNSAAGGGGAENFPSLGESVTKVVKQKKKKGQTLSFSEFAAGVYVGPGGRNRSGGAATGAGLTTDERMMLPTRPRERSAVEEAEGHGPGRLGGGFRDYGRSREGATFRNTGCGGGERGSNRRPFDENNDNRRPSMRSDEADMPSRSDGVDNWAVSKKLASSALSRSEYVASRADGVEDWGASKVPSARARSDYVASRADGLDGWGAGRKPSTPPFWRIYAGTRADESGEWGAGKKSISVLNATPYHRSEVHADTERWGRSQSGKEFSPSGSPRPEAKPKVNPFGAARPREEILAQKGQDWRKLDADLETRSNASRPTSAHSSRPGSGHSSHSSRPQSPMVSLQFIEVAIASREKPKVNPFGDAKPREMVLEQRGKDYRKMDFELEHRAVDRSETEEEQKLKEEINALKELAKEIISDESKVNELDSVEPTLTEIQPTLKEKITLLEKQLELLIRALDDKVRFGKKGGDSRPGSASGRPFEHLERPGQKDVDGRPGSAAGRPFEHLQKHWKKGGDSRPGSAAGHAFEYLERPGSRSGLSDAGKTDSFESPRSRRGRDRVDLWTRANEERQVMHFDRERSFTDRNRLTSGERW